MVTWIVAGASLVGTIANAYQKRWCFPVWLCTNAFWVIHDLSIASYAQASLFAAYFVIAAIGWYNWSKMGNHKRV